MITTGRSLAAGPGHMTHAMLMTGSWVSGLPGGMRSSVWLDALRRSRVSR